MFVRRSVDLVVQRLVLFTFREKSQSRCHFDEFRVDVILRVIDLSNHEIRYIFSVLSELFQGWDDLSTSLFLRVVKQNKDIVLSVLNN